MAESSKERAIRGGKRRFSTASSDDGKSEDFLLSPTPSVSSPPPAPPVGAPPKSVSFFSPPPSQSQTMPTPIHNEPPPIVSAKSTPLLPLTETMGRMNFDENDRKLLELQFHKNDADRDGFIDLPEFISAFNGCSYPHLISL
jgi:hypothetical protein